MWQVEDCACSIVCGRSKIVPIALCIPPMSQPVKSVEIYCCLLWHHRVPKPEHLKTVKGFRETGVWSEIVAIFLEADQTSVEWWNWKPGVRCLTLSALTLSALRCLPYAYAVSLRQKAQADFVVAALFCSILVIQWTSLTVSRVAYHIQMGVCYVWQLEIMTHAAQLCWKGVNHAELKSCPLILILICWGWQQSSGCLLTLQKF